MANDKFQRGMNKGLNKSSSYPAGCEHSRVLNSTGNTEKHVAKTKGNVKINGESMGNNSISFNMKMQPVRDEYKKYINKYIYNRVKFRDSFGYARSCRVLARRNMLASRGLAITRHV